MEVWGADGKMTFRGLRPSPPLSPSYILWVCYWDARLSVAEVQNGESHAVGSTAPTEFSGRQAQFGVVRPRSARNGARGNSQIRRSAARDSGHSSSLVSFLCPSQGRGQVPGDQPREGGRILFWDMHLGTAARRGTRAPRQGCRVQSSAVILHIPNRVMQWANSVEARMLAACRGLDGIRGF